MALQKTPITQAPANLSLAVPAIKGTSPKNLKQSVASSRAFWIGLGVSLGWVATVMAVIASGGPAHSIGGVPLADLALGVSAAVSPVAMVWMVTAYLQRAADIQTVADPLRRQLSLITGESGAADARIRRFNQAIREQIDLLRSAQSISQDDLEGIMDRVRQHRGELERFESVSGQQVKEIQDVMRRSMLQVEQMMDDKFTMLKFLDGKLQQNGDGVARQIETMRDQAAKMLEDVEQTSAQMADALERATRDSKKLADTSRLQESSLSNAAETAVETLGGLTSKIDLSVARFLERASTAREEAERLAGAIDAQSRALDDLTSTLPARVSEAEAVLRGVADRLYASEQMAREQAVYLSEKLASQVDGLQSFMDRFTQRLTEIDTSLDRRHSDLGQVASRIYETTDGFFGSWQKSLVDLHDRTGNALLRFTVMNDETRRNADGVTANLNETTSRYEDVVVRMRALTQDSSVQMKGMTEEISQQLGQFEKLSAASAQAGQEVQTRANAALQNLQHVLERVLTARDATQTIGEALVKDIQAAVDQNEKMIARLSETAQVGARTVGAAAEQLGRQESELAGKSRAGEAVMVEAAQKLQQQAESTSAILREQTATLMNLLAETHSQLIATDHKLQSFATTAIMPVQAAVEQIDRSSEQGLRSITHYNDGVGQQVARLQEFHARIGGMSDDMGKTTAQTAGVFEILCARFAAVRDSQDQSAREILAQYGDLSARLQNEVSGLDGQSAKAVEALQQAALRVGEQSYQMLENAKSSGAQIKDIATGLQAEAKQIQHVLNQQAEAIHGDLARAEQKFTAIGESLRVHADTAYGLIDRVVAHCDDKAHQVLTDSEQTFTSLGDMVRSRSESATLLVDRTASHYAKVAQETAQDLENRAQKIDQTVTVAHGKMEQLGQVLERQAQQISAGANQIDGQSESINLAATRAVQNLSVLNDKMAITHEAALTYAQQTLTKIDETSVQFERQTRGLSNAAVAATESVVKAGAVFGEESSKLIDGGFKVDGVLRQLASATAAVAEQAAQIRVNMEQQNMRLLAQLTDAVAQMDVTGGKLQQTVGMATQGVDHVATRFHDMTETASQRIGTASAGLHAVAERTESTLAALGANVTQQAASLSIVSEQMAEQQRVLAIANEKQRTQMLDLFDQLRGAHLQASEVAERSIAHLTASLQDIHRHMGLVGDKSQESVGLVKMASMGFSEQAQSLLQNAQAAEQQARTVLTVTSALQDQARQLREQLQLESERAGETLTVLVHRLISSGQDVRELGTSTSAVFTGLQRAIGEQSSELGLSMQQISDRQKTLTSALDAQREVINGLLNRLTLAQDETAAVSERAAMRLGDSTQQMTRQVEILDARAQSAMATVGAASSQFAAESESIERHARQAEHSANALVVSATGMGEQISTLRSAMQSEGERTHAVMGVLLDKVTAGAQDMRTLSQSTEMALTSLGHTVTQQSTALASSMQNISDRQKSLTIALDAQRDVINGLLNRLILAQDETATTADRAAARLTEGATQIMYSASKIDSRATTAMESVQAASTGFAHEAEQIEAHARRAELQTKSIFDAASGLQNHIGDLRATMQADGESIRAALSEVVTSMVSHSEDLRGSGTVAESSLISLQNVITEQAATMTQSMQQIDERQQKLTQTLDVQRDAIHAVLNRLTLAQDETAKLAERTTASLADSARKMTDQLDAVGDQATTTLVQVDAAVSGFVTQASLLSQQGQQAEQQMRGLLSATAGMQDQARHLREAMQVESARVIEQLGAVIAQLDQSQQSLKSDVTTTTNILTTTAQHVAALTDSSAQAMRAQAGMLADASHLAEDRITEAGDMMRSHLRLVGQMGDQAQTQARQLADASEFATTRLVALRDNLSLSDKESQAIVVAASQRIDEIRQDLHAEMARLAEMSNRTVEQVGEASQRLSSQSDALRANVATSESALNEAAALVRAEAAYLPGVMNRSISDIETAGRALKAQTVEADQVLIGTADRFIAVTAAARNNMIDEMRHVSGMADDASKVLGRFGQMLAEQISSVQKGALTLSVEQKTLLDKTAQSVDVLAAASDRLKGLHADASDTAARLKHEFDLLDQRQVASVDRLVQTSSTVAKQVDMLGEAAVIAERKMTGAGDQFRDQFERIRTGLQTQIDDINRGLMQITAQLERTGSTLRSTAVGAVADVERVGHRFEQTSGDATAQIEARTHKMQAATEEVSQLLTGFDTMMQSMLARMAIAGQGLKSQEGDTVAQMQNMLTHLAAVAEKLEMARQLSGNVSQHAIERLDEVVNAVQAHMNNMTSGAQAAAGVMRGINQIYNDQTQSLAKGVGETQNQVVSLNQSIDAMQERTDRMRSSLKLQGDELMNSLRQILAQLEMTGDGLSEAVDRTLQEQAEIHLKKIS